MTEFGPSYAATATGDTDIGLQAEAVDASGVALPVIEVEDLEATLEAVRGAGGAVTVPIFRFPVVGASTSLTPAETKLAVAKSGDSAT